MITGRGAGFNAHNPFQKQQRVTEHIEGLDEEAIEHSRITKVHLDNPKTVVNKVNSPDVPLNWSINPYQGCEHGCIYCYARNSHTYWGYSAGLDFEQQIIAKPNAPELLRKYLSRKKYQPEAISLSGNTDCYQPLERKMRITRQLLEVFLEFQHPVGIITKNQLILRDLDILIPLAQMGLVGVMVSITTLDENLRRKMEPRTTSATNRLKTIETLRSHGIPAGVMMAPIIPGLTSHEIPQVLQKSASAGALDASYTMLRLNGQVADLFTEWLEREYPDRKNKILLYTQNTHGGSLNDSRFGTRMRGEGAMAESIGQHFQQYKSKLFTGKMPPLNHEIFRQNLNTDGQGKLF